MPRKDSSSKNPRHEFSEPGVENHAQREPGEGAAGDSARRFEEQNDREAAEDPAIRRKYTETIGNGGVQNRDVKSDGETTKREQPVIPRNVIARLFRINLDGEKHTAQRQRKKQREILLLEKRDLEVVVNFQRP